ncbi:MAG: DUF5452 domain-containing protein [Mycoplasmoidaceae bacterium]
MIKLSKKAIGAITATSVLLITGSTVIANVLLKDEQGIKPIDNPLGRDKSYHYYSLVNKMAANEHLNNLITVVQSGSSIAYIIDENKFLSNIKIIVQDTLKQIPAFAEDYLSYSIDCHYQINTKSILVDLVWAKPDAKNKFFDQFELILQSS